MVCRRQLASQRATGDFVLQLEYAEQSVQLEAENWRLCSTTLVRG